MKRLVLGLLVVISTLQGFSKGIDIEEAKEVSNTFFKTRSKAALTIQEAVIFQSDETALTYVINYQPEGWAIVSADDRAPAILAYSSTGHFDTKEVKTLPFYFWYEGYADQISTLIKSKAPEKVHPSWNEIKTSKYTKAVDPVEPLIEVLWNQGSGWNAYSPIDADGPGGHAYAGCVAVAMAQCMSVYQHPTQGSGSYSYIHDTYGTQSANFGETTYDWANMKNEGASDAVALLLYHLGVSVNMGYGADGSGAFSSRVPGAIKTYFDYSNSAQIISKSDYTDEEWENVLIDQLSQGQPIYYSGDGGDGEAGHAFNIDGVNSQGAFHFNFGWSGNYNGYYFLTSITPGSHDFTFDQDAVINFTPRDHSPKDITLSNKTVEEGMPVGTVVGELAVDDETPDDVFTYEVYGSIGLSGAQLSVPFTEQDGNLVTTEVLDYADKDRYEVIVKATDITNLSVEKNFFINVDVNSAPTNITISNLELDDTISVGRFIGKFSTVDQDAEDNFTYSFEVNSASNLSKDNNKFIISNDSLFTNYDFTTYTEDECNIYIKSTDKKGESVLKEFVLTINKSVQTYINSFHVNEINIYPNPVTNYLNVSLKENCKMVKIFDIVGNMKYVSTEESNQYEIDFSRFNNGLYFVNIEMTNGQINTFKVLKKD